MTAGRAPASSRTPVIPFRQLFQGHRQFDIAEVCRCSYYRGYKKCLNEKDPNKDIDVTLITKCITEIKTKLQVVVRTGSNDRILELSRHIEESHKRRAKNFAKIYTEGGGMEFDLSPRVTSAKGILRWAIEKYTLFHISIRYKSPKDFLSNCERDKGLFRSWASLVSRYVFGDGGKEAFRSSVRLYLGEDGEIHYRIDPPPKVIWELSRLGVPRRYINDVLTYFVAVGVAMLTSLECYGGEPAVPVIRIKSCGEPLNVKLETRSLDLHAGMHYGEWLMEELICGALNAK